MIIRFSWLDGFLTKQSFPLPKHSQLSSKKSKPLTAIAEGVKEMKLPYLVFFLVALTLPSRAQDATNLQNRLTAFQNAQITCKALVLSSSEAASAFVGATKSSLSDVCECAALLTVASQSADQISALAAGDKVISSQMATKVQEHFVQCVKIS